MIYLLVSRRDPSTSLRMTAKFTESLLAPRAGPQQEE
jgi:hypothetical protein